MFGWFVAALGASQAPSEVVCAEPPVGPPKGAASIAASALPWAHQRRQEVMAEKPVAPDPAMVDWLQVDLKKPPAGTVALALHAARDPNGEGGWVVAQAQAPVRPAVVPVNLTVVVDVAPSMTSVVTRNLPLLQDMAPVYDIAPVTRLELARAAVIELIEHLPPESRLSLVAIDGSRARVLLEPTEDPVRMTARVQDLVPGIVGAIDAPIESTLESIGTRTFTPCDDNRALLFSNHLDDLPRQAMLASVERWSAPDVQRWTFAVGDFGPLDPNEALLDGATQTASWVVNGVSDLGVIVPALLDAGGMAVSQVELEVGFPEGTRWAKLPDGTPRSGTDPHTFASLNSGQGWSATYRVEGALEGIELRAKVEDWTGVVEVQDAPALAEADPALRNRLAALAPAVMPWEQLPAQGQGAELGAWMRPQLAREPAPIRVAGAWIEPAGDAFELGVSVVVQPGLPSTPEALRIDAAPGAPPAAWMRSEDRIDAVWTLPNLVHAVRVEGAGLPGSDPVPLRVNHRWASRIRFLDAVRRGVAWVPEAPVDPVVALVLAQQAAAIEDHETVLRWTEDCEQNVRPALFLGCSRARGAALVALERLDEAEAVLTAALAREPVDSALSLARGDIAWAREELDDAEFYYLRALIAQHDAVAVHRLGVVMEAQKAPNLEALAWAYHLLHDPTDEVARARFRFLVDRKRWKTVGGRGPLGDVELPKGKRRYTRTYALLEAYSQAWRRGTRRDDKLQDVGWYQAIGEVFSDIERSRRFRGATVRILIPPEHVPEEERENVRAIEWVLPLSQ